MSNLHALLIAVDFYFPHTLPEGIFYPPLGGCVRDVGHVEAYLTSQRGLSQQNIIKLAASVPGSSADGPPEPREQWPTYANMVAAFKALIDRTDAGDQVYVHYSGHGGRARTLFPRIKTEGGVDEGLVPLDIGQPDAQYLRDVELAYLIQQLVDKQVLLTVVFDSCHSGGATRGVEGKTAVKRGGNGTDILQRPPQSAVAPMEKLEENWLRVAPAKRNARTTSAWQLEPKGYTFLAACREAESALEFPFNGFERNGALTYWMLDTLRQAGQGWSYKMLHDRILAKVHGQFSAQTPQLQGDGDREIFGSNRIKSHYAAPVLRVESDRVRINAGEVHGIQEGDQFAIYPVDAPNFTDKTHRRGLVTVDEAEDSSSWATIDERGAAPMEEGDQAVLLKSVRLRRHVACFEMDAAQQQQVEAAVRDQGQGFLDVAGSGVPADFQITVIDDEYQINDAAGSPIPRLGAAIHVQDENTTQKLVNRLVHLTKFQNVKTLDAPDGDERQKIQVELVVENDGENDDIIDSSDETPVLPPGQKVTLRITNLQEPVPPEPHNPEKILQPILNIAILNLASDWSIEQIYPTGNNVTRAIDPGETLELPFETVLEAWQEESQDLQRLLHPAAGAGTAGRRRAGGGPPMPPARPPPRCGRKRRPAPRL